MYIAPLAQLVWCWYWQSQVYVEDTGFQGYTLTLPNQQILEVEMLPESWLYSGEVTGLHPATYATESIWEQVQSLEWRIVDGTYCITKLSPKRVDYRIPAEKVPHSNHLSMTKLLRQGLSNRGTKGVRAFGTHAEGRASPSPRIGMYMWGVRDVHPQTAMLVLLPVPPAVAAVSKSCQGCTH
jgi:hypothetical protein